MKKIFYLMTILVSFLSFSVYVSAARGDLIYNVDSVRVSDRGINIQGYAFIHRTQNYVTIYKRFESYSNNVSTTEIVASGGGHTTIIVAANCDYANDDECRNNGKYVKKTYSYDPYEAEKNNEPVAKNYNFYYQQYNGNKEIFSVDLYNNYSSQTCQTGGSGECYYEDIGFNITFSVDELISKFSDDDKLYFYIAAYNNHYGKETVYKPLAISGISGNSDYVDISETKIKGLVNFIAGTAHWQKSTGGKFADGFFGCTRPRVDDSSFGRWSWCYSDNDFDTRVKNSEYHMMKADYGGLLIPTTNNWAYNNSKFLTGTGSPGMYAFCVNVSGGERRQDGCSNIDNDFCTDCSRSNTKVLYAFSSWVEIHGDNQFIIKVKNPHACEVTNPDENNGNLKCNDSKTLNSSCEELSIDTNKGRATVKIEQKGIISSVLTPDKIYAGGGFNFGVMYYNTIKWSYVGSRPNNELHNAVVEEMNKKLKSYDSYIAGLNITELKLGDKKFSTYDASFLNKLCTTSDRNNDYYDKELTVSCVFSFPESILYPDGTVKYNTGVGNFNINNKYYTNINYDSNYDKYKLEANIVGMDRITENAAKNDSAEEGKAWTGDWSDTFTNCEIDLYPLLMKDSRYNFIYRPIDISNPFPSRNAGINWYDWYNDNYNKSLLENTYSDLEYTVILGNQSISEIKEYNNDLNNSGGYLNWDSIDTDGKSSFVDEYVTREEGVR